MIMVLKPTNKYQDIQQCHNFRNILNNNFQGHPFLYIAKVLQKSFLQSQNKKHNRRDS